MMVTLCSRGLATADWRGFPAIVAGVGVKENAGFEHGGGELLGGRHRNLAAAPVGLPSCEHAVDALGAGIALGEHQIQWHRHAAQPTPLDCRADAMLADVRACDDPKKARLIFDAERWYLSKLAPKRFGDKVSLAGDVDAPLVQSVAVQFISATATAVEAAHAYQRLLGN